MNWFKYRLPGANETVGGCSDRLANGMTDGFVIAPFINPTEGVLTIPKDSPFPSDISNSCHSLPSSTSSANHRREVEAIVKMLGSRGGKTVAARILRIDNAIDLSATFSTLCTVYPDAFVFMFHTDDTGTWIGASPELLLKKTGMTLSTMSLAGTRPAGTMEEWDIKNVDEQQMVTDFISAALQPFSVSISTGITFTKEAGPVEHICTPIEAILDKNHDMTSILAALSPTPALCGSDREVSLKIISEYEDFPRHMYGGFCGPMSADGDFSYFVILRCAQCTVDAAALYVGGGITPLSDPQAEWTETELKAMTLKRHFKFKKQQYFLIPTKER